MNFTWGSQSSKRGQALSATRLSGSVGISGTVGLVTGGPCPCTASMTRVRSIVPRFTAVPSSIRSAANGAADDVAGMRPVADLLAVPHTHNGSGR